MTKPANKERGEVAVPGLGDGAFIRFTMDSLERLQSQYGKTWLEDILAELAADMVPTFKTCFEVGGLDAELLDDLRPLEPVKMAIYDALFLMLYGKDFAEKREEEEQAEIDRIARGAERLKKLDPQTAALIFSSQFGEQATEPASDQTKSAA